jgi:molybdopterin-biosynthesis enzyme MoeA-like protein
MLAKLLRRVTTLPGVPQSRHVAERAVAPYLRADLTSLHQQLLATIERLDAVEAQLRELVATVGAIEQYQPAVLNAISSTNGTARVLRRELEAVRQHVTALAEPVTS